MERSPNDPDFMKIPPRPINEFRLVPPTEKIIIPDLSKNRICTNPIFLIVFAGFVAILIGVSVYFVSTANIKRLINGYDSCGNICGIKNTEIEADDMNCKPEDHTNHRILFYTTENRTCIKEEECQLPDRVLFFRRCFPKTTPKHLLPKKKIHESIHELLKAGDIMLIMFVIVGVLSIMMYLCFKIHARITVASLLGLAGIVSTIGTLASWYIYLTQDKHIFLFPGIIGLIYLGSMIILAIFLSNRFLLMVRLYAEATRAIFEAPVLLAQPLFTILFVLALDGVLVYMLLPFLLPDEDGNLYNEKFRVPYIMFLVFMTYWLFAFANGCQCMIIAGVVAAHFFSRDKPKLRCTYLKSVCVTVRYHLGSVAAGALIITILRILRPFAERLEHKSVGFCIKAQGKCCAWLHETAAYLSKKGYIMIAFHGRSLYESGSRAVRLLWLFFCDTVGIDGLCCVSMHLVSFFFVFCSVIVGLTMIVIRHLKYDYIPLFVGVYLAGTVTFFYVSLMNVVVETLFVCFCEDRLLNTGTRYNPYFMNSELFNLMIEALELAYKEHQQSDPNE